METKYPRVMKYIPKRKIEAVKSCWHDEDGYWITLNEGWEYDYGHTIHEETIALLRDAISQIEKVN